MPAIIHYVVDHARGWERVAWALFAGLGASSLVELSTYGYAIPTLLIFVSFFWRHPAHARLLSVAFAWAAPYMFKEFQLYGLYATVLIVMTGLWFTRVASHGNVTKWASGVIIMLGSYFGLAWTFGLTSAGVDFVFAIQWLPGRLHEQFWWVIAIVTTYKCMAHVPLFVLIIQRIFGREALDIANAAAALALFRYVFVAVFAIAWLVAADEQAGGMRLAAMLQDAFFWLLPGLILAGMVRLGPRSSTEEIEE